MSIEADLNSLLSPLVAGEVYPDVGIEPSLPYITYQQVGGESLAFLERAIPSKRNGRFRVRTWATTRVQASALMRQVHDTLITAAALQVTAQGEQLADYDEETKRFGSMQDFGIWFDTSS